nr:MAG TPA: fibrinogen-binding protein [Caudoviricetes sp.]
MLCHMSTTRTATRLTVAASLLIALVFALLPVGSAAAESGVPRVTVSDLTLQRVDRTGAAVDGGLTLWSNARLGFSWSGDPKPGDSFTIGLGDSFSALGSGETKPLTMSVAGRDVEIGSCELSAHDVTCTFGDAVGNLRAEGYTDFHGTGFAFVVASKVLAAGPATMTANGVVTQVPTPNGEGVVGPQDSQWTLAKWGSNPYAGGTRVDWGIDFGANDETAAKLGKTFDGSTQTITFSDTLGEGMRFITDEPSATTWTRRVNGSDETLGTAATAGEFTIAATYGEDGHSATYTVTGPFQNNTNYQLRYPTRFAAEQGQPDKAVVGRQYFNHVELDGGAMKEGACVVVQQGFGVDAGANLTPKPEPTPTPSVEPTPTPSVEPKKPEPTPTPSVEPELAHTGIAAGGAALTAGALIGAGLLIRNRRNR